MKKLIQALLVLMLLVALAGCSKNQESVSEERISVTKPLEIEKPKRNYEGLVVVYAMGMEEAVYRGRIEIENDGTDGEEIFIFVYAGAEQ